MKIKRGAFVKPFMPRVKSYRRQDLPPLYYLDGQVVAIRTEVLMGKQSDKVHGWMGSKVGIVLQPSIYGMEVHDRDDLKMANILVGGLGL